MKIFHKLTPVSQQHEKIEITFHMSTKFCFPISDYHYSQPFYGEKPSSETMFIIYHQYTREIS